MTEYFDNFLDDTLTTIRGLEADPPVETPTALRELGTAVLRALSSMAQINQRHQAVVNEALHRAGLSVSADTIANVLRKLRDEGCIEKLIPLSDGALLLTVTAVGMSRTKTS